MPEVLEAEMFRRLAQRSVGRLIERVSHYDDYVARPLTRRQLTGALVGQTIERVGRKGKLMLVELDSGSTLGVHFGMAGRLIVDGAQVIEKLEYAPERLEPRWFRFGLELAGGGSVELVDPRRLSRVSLDPDRDQLGPDAFTLTAEELGAALGSSRAPLKARLMDQGRIAGLGNLLVDESLWRAGLAPTREAGSLRAVERKALLDAIRSTLTELGERGGSHTGDLHLARVPGSSCPRCGEALRRDQVGGRTTYWCPAEQG